MLTVAVTVAVAVAVAATVRGTVDMTDSQMAPTLTLMAATTFHHLVISPSLQKTMLSLSSFYYIPLSAGVPIYLTRVPSPSITLTLALDCVNL